MVKNATVPAVRRSVTVAAPVDRAFHVFTAGFGTWWPADFHIGEADPSEFRLEQRQGGRWYERGTDGTECDWGRVLAWDPPHRVVLSWHINGSWAYEPDEAQASEIEVTFTPDESGGTRVDLEHRRLERHGADAEALRAQVADDGGWGTLLRRYADAVPAG